MLTLLFVSQTIASAFDSHSEHQEIESGLASIHKTLDDSHKSHDEGEFSQKTVDNDQQQSDFDCHHCCHCHTPSNIGIADNETTKTLHNELTAISGIDTSLLTLWLTPEHRPPISSLI